MLLTRHESGIHVVRKPRGKQRTGITDPGSHNAQRHAPGRGRVQFGGAEIRAIRPEGLNAELRQAEAGDATGRPASRAAASRRSS
jgi:hypothetical protein